VATCKAKSMRPILFLLESTCNPAILYGFLISKKGEA
jgi:hypothetical protein